MNISHEVLSKDEAYRIANTDGKLNSASDSYAKENCFTYYVAINTWYYIIKDCDEWAASAILEYISRNGLLRTIAETDAGATALVKGEDVPNDISKLLVSISRGSSKKYFGLNPERNVFKDDLATALQLLRYLKRFSPLKNDWIKRKTLEDFVRCENQTKLRQRREYPVWLVTMVRDAIEQIVNWDEFIERFDNLSPYDFVLPTGTTYEGLVRPVDKITELASCYPERFMQPFGYPWIIPRYTRPKDLDACRVQAVPKSYKASRIIAMEPIGRQSIAGSVNRILQDLLPECIDVRDQSRNQKLAEEGSKNGLYATLDASHASDLISKTLFREVFPVEVVSRIDPLFSHYTSIDGNVRTMQMMSTAGHNLTFCLETLVYYGIAAAACSYCALYNPSKWKVSVYGDDVVLPSEAAETAMDFYSLLGLQINRDKSYWTGFYRESCGEEYMDGVNLTTVYYPRFPVIGSFTSKSIQLGVRMYRDSYRGKIDDSTTMLVDLQKRLFSISRDASLFVWEVVKDARPRITSSKFGEICNDLWAATEIAIPDNPAERMKERGYDIPNSVISLCASSKHSYASIHYSNATFEYSLDQQRAIDIFRYQYFLKNGPFYASPLDELLGVSSPQYTDEQLAGEGKLVWKYVRS